MAQSEKDITKSKEASTIDIQIKKYAREVSNYIKQLESNKQLTNKEKKSFLSSMLALQNLIAKKYYDDKIPLFPDGRESRIYGIILSSGVEILAQNGISIPNPRNRNQYASFSLDGLMLAYEMFIERDDTFLINNRDDCLLLAITLQNKQAQLWNTINQGKSKLTSGQYKELELLTKLAADLFELATHYGASLIDKKSFIQKKWDLASDLLKRVKQKYRQRNTSSKPNVSLKPVGPYYEEVEIKTNLINKLHRLKEGDEIVFFDGKKEIVRQVTGDVVNSIFQREPDKKLTYGTRSLDYYIRHVNEIQSIGKSTQYTHLKHQRKEPLPSPNSPTIPVPKTVKNNETFSSAQVHEIIGNNWDTDLTRHGVEFTSTFAVGMAGSDIGFTDKPTNEDRVVVSSRNNFFAVIDGMGGPGNGDYAAEIFAEELLEHASYLNEPGITNNTTEKTNLIGSAVYNTTSRLESEFTNQVGSVFIAAHITQDGDKKFLDYYSSGDAALLVIDKDGYIKHSNHKDSKVDEMVNQGLITLDQALYHEERNVVTNYIGVGNSNFDTYRVEVEAGDRVIMMSDGISDNFTDLSIRNRVVNKSIQSAFYQLDADSLTRMKSYNAIWSETKKQGGREHLGRFSDGERSAPKQDNRSLIIFDIV